MIDVVTNLHFKKDQLEEIIPLFGRINETARSFELHYEQKTPATICLGAEDFLGRRFNFAVKGTDSKLYVVYSCLIQKQVTSLMTSGMVTLEGIFERLVLQQDPNDKYTHVSFSFDGIENVFPRQSFQVEWKEFDGPISITKPGIEKKKIKINDELTCSIIPAFSGITSSPCPEIHISQQCQVNLHINVDKNILEILLLLNRIKQYFEFLFSKEIQMTSVFFNNDIDLRKRGEVITDPILLPHTFIKPIRKGEFLYTVESALSGLGGWLEKYDSLNRVIKIWQKTIYNTNVSDEDIFIWRCQAFELLCALTPAIDQEARRHLEKKQSNPNIKNYLIAVCEQYGIAKAFKPYFSDVKAVRDKLTHNNPKKNVTSTQTKNSYEIVNSVLVSTMSKVVGIDCRTPMVIVTSNSKND